MRHRVVRKKFGRDVEHKNAMLKNLMVSLFTHEKVETTVEKAKYLRSFAEKLITRAKLATTEDKIQRFNTIKYLKAKLSSENTVRKLVDEIAPQYKTVNGGYTRIKKTGNRAGDNAFLARIELISQKKSKKTTAKKETKVEIAQEVVAEETTNESK